MNSFAFGYYILRIGWLYWGLKPLWQLKSYHGGRWRAYVSWLSHTSTITNFFPKPPTTFLTCFIIRRKEILPQPGLELTTSRSWVRHVQNWPTQAGHIWMKCFPVLFTCSYGAMLGSVVKCLTRNFRRSVLWQDTSEPQPSTGETLERHEWCELSPWYKWNTVESGVKHILSINQLHVPISFLADFGKKSKLTLSQTTFFRLFQTERVCRRLFQIW